MNGENGGGYSDDDYDGVDDDDGDDLVVVIAVAVDANNMNFKFNIYGVWLQIDYVWT